MITERIITEKGQVTIPSELRKRYNLLPGKKVVFIPTKDGILIKPSPEMTSLRGILGKTVDLEKLETIVENLRKEWRIE